MASALFLVLLLIGAGALAINRVALRGWAAAAILAGLAALAVTRGGLYILPGLMIMAGFLFAGLAVTSLRRRMLTGPAYDLSLIHI